MGVPRGNILAIASAWALWLVLAALLHLRFVPTLYWGPPLLLQFAPLVLIGLLLVTVSDFRHGWSRSSSIALVLCLMPLAIFILGSLAQAA